MKETRYILLALVGFGLLMLATGHIHLACAIQVATN